MGRTVLKTVSPIVSRMQRGLFATVAADPMLPGDLLPEDWPRGDVPEALDRLYQALAPAVIEHLREILPGIEIALMRRGGSEAA
jgi:DNA-binding transcriptional regulator PaaX